jgi:hypothetical protein
VLTLVTGWFAEPYDSNRARERLRARIHARTQVGASIADPAVEVR